MVVGSTDVHIVGDLIEMENSSRAANTEQPKIFILVVEEVAEALLERGREVEILAIGLMTKQKDVLNTGGRGCPVTRIESIAGLGYAKVYTAHED